MTAPTQPDAGELRNDYRRLMRMAARGTFDLDEAYELIHVCLELAKMGYTLNADETDWVAKETDTEPYIAALRDLEHAVNRSVSGMRVDVSEWLALLRQARAVLGDRVKE